MAEPIIGVEKIDPGAAARLGIVLVVNSPAPKNYTGAVEATIGLILVLAKRPPVNQRRLRKGEWKDRWSLGTLLAGKTVRTVRLGRIETNIPGRLAGWDADLRATGTYAEPALAHAAGAQLTPFEMLVQSAGIRPCTSFSPIKPST